MPATSPERSRRAGPPQGDEARRQDKSDRQDARSVALCVLCEAGLPPMAAEDDTAVLDLLASQRDGAVAEAMRLRCQLHQLLGQLDPEYAARLPKSHTRAGLRALDGVRHDRYSPIQRQRAAAVRRLAQRLRLALTQANNLTREIRALAAARFAPLARICGGDLLTAGVLAGIMRLGRRFATDAQRAAYAGVAPPEAPSAERVRHRLSRGGNRRPNAILFRIVPTQSRHVPTAQTYLARRASEGKTRREAVRALKRFVVRAIWRRWQECPMVQETGPTAALAA